MAEANPLPSVLIVDDESLIRRMIAQGLEPVCRRVGAAANITEALQMLQKAPYDVVLCDVCMPGGDGLELLGSIIEENWDVAFIIMTGHARLDQVVSAVQQQASDFLLKPFSLEKVIESVQRSYDRLCARRSERYDRLRLAEDLQMRTTDLQHALHELETTRDLTLSALLSTLDAREHDTYAHSLRVRAYTLHLAKLINYPEHLLTELGQAAVLHDIGKVAVPDAILMKPGPLTLEERKRFETHTIVGEQILRRACLPPGVANIVRHHHEHWDGSGYPDRLRGAGIPLGARLFAFADTLDVMTSNRCYRNAGVFAQARLEIILCTGTQFDPGIMPAFISVKEETWARIREESEAQAQALDSVVEARHALTQKRSAQPTTSALPQKAVGIS